MKSQENKILQKVVLPSESGSQKGITPPLLLPMPKQPSQSVERPAQSPPPQQTPRSTPEKAD